MEKIKFLETRIKILDRLLFDIGRINYLEGFSFTNNEIKKIKKSTEKLFKITNKELENLKKVESEKLRISQLNLKEHQHTLLEDIQSEGFNIVTCGTCGTIIIHVLTDTEITCYNCLYEDDVCNFPNLY